PYIQSLLKTITQAPRVFRISTGGCSFTVQASGVFISNVEDLGIGKPADLRHLNDGFLDLHVVNPRHFKDYLRLTQRYAGGIYEKTPADVVMKVQDAVVEMLPRAGRRSSFQEKAYEIYSKFSKESELYAAHCMVDGDLAGRAPMMVRVLPTAVTVLVPPWFAQSLNNPNLEEFRRIRLIAS
ncbi:MAG: hypothetical protein K2X27_14840, partial [Candidatus Obscuribacterales bacterium]|nr:hypothetical protein [Candidatus Obscuribacterales bacterium]